MISDKRIWACLTGCCVLALPVVYFLKLEKSPPDQLRIVARGFEKGSGLSGDYLYSILKVEQKLYTGNTISEPEFALLEEASKSPHIQFRSEALLYLGRLDRTQFRDRAHEIMHRLALDPDPGTRSIAIIDLVESHDADAGRFMTLGENSNSSYVRQTVAIMRKRQKNAT